MKKNFMLLMFVFSAWVNMQAQDLPMAILHSDTISTYYGTDALVSAYNVAKDGDIIVLSSGSFTNCPEITKVITIRGAGMETKPSSNITPTILRGDFKIATNWVTLEGLYFPETMSAQAEGCSFIKCRFDFVGGNVSTGFLVDAQFIQCKIKRLQFYHNSSSNFINTVIGYTLMDINSTAEFTNCVLSKCNHMCGNSRIVRLQNCILCNDEENSKLEETQKAYNCVYIGPDNIFFQNQSSSTNIYLSEFSSIFKTYNGIYTDEENYELTDEAKALYLGNDGKEIGLYGGNLPYNTVTPLPYVSKKEIASQTENGKLKINITVKVGE